ncbi:MAG: ROK family protein [Acidobacteria bacterium]|nr:ROK family protein [Acidobacteriota bacterium]
MIGLELRDAGALALVASPDGEVVRRAAVAGSDVAAAAFDALDRIGAASVAGAPVGVATAMGDAAAGVAALDRLRGRGLAIGSPVGAGAAAALAESWIGAARGREDVVLFSAGEHPVGGIVRRGVPIDGARGRAASVAWLALNPVEREDYRKAGCLEAEVGAAGIVRRLLWRIKAGDRSRAQEMAGGELSAITLDHLLDAARQNDGVAFSVVRDTARYLGMAAANLVAIADPETLVLGGLMASAADLFLDPVRVEIGRRLPAPMLDALTIVPSAIGADAAAIGAARLAASPAA